MDEVSIGKGTGVAGSSLEELVSIAQMALDLAPNPADELVRQGLISVALKRQSAADTAGFGEAPIRAGDCLEAARAMPKMLFAEPVAPELARALAMALLVHAGDLKDPSGGANAVMHHRDDTSAPSLGTPCALLGEFLFFE